MLVEKTKTQLQIFFFHNLLSTSLATETNQLSYYPNSDSIKLYPSTQTMALLRSRQMTVMPGGFPKGVHRIIDYV